MTTTRRTASLLKILRAFTLTVAIFTIYLIHNEEWSAPIRNLRDLHPFQIIPDEIKAKPCNIQQTPEDFYSHGDMDNQPSRILYLVQTEECLPDHLRLALGDSSACQCDVAVLSFKNICNDTSLPHVTYLFNSSTTWTTGRNLLYYTNIHKQSERYLYYILMDDDIELRWRERWGLILHNKDPWRSYEEFLRRMQPPIAALQLLESPLERIEEICASRNCCMDMEHTITVWYDAAFNAFHYKAVEYVLPYWDKMENESWWYSQLHQIAWAEVVFRGQVVTNRKLIAHNPVHRPYPRATTDKYDSVLRVIVEDIRERVPTNCQNASLLRKHEQNGFEHLRTTSSTYCLLPPPPKQTIVPFRHFVC